MPNNDEGEFELVLGNRQLISVFLIIVILLGVFFSMGYIVGRNSMPVAEAARNNPPANPIRVENPQQPPAPSGESTPAPETPRVENTRQPSRPAPAERALEPKPAQTHPAVPADDKPQEATRASMTAQPAAGEYWQAIAAARPDAELIAEELAKKGMKAIIAPAPKDGYFRVLVGPLPDAGVMADTRTKLENAGFNNPIMRKY